ncbi:MAG: hypothetical protein KAT05_07285 [Spirochaetes bacterium]|nr:hypothetical protein [Spirochaetota bacterium]
MLKKILIVDDDSSFVVRVMNSISSGARFCFSIADSLKRAKYLLNNDKFDLILANVKVPGGNSLELKKEVIAIAPDTNFLFMSSIDADYDFIKNKGEKCYHKYELNNTIGALFKNA